MAIVTRYFSTSSAGAGDGTSWANRAALLSAGVFSTIIKSFGFNGSDSLRCLIGPGTYTVTDALSVTDITNPPTVANPLILHGCDSSGVALIPPYGWTSDQPAWSDTNLPLLTGTVGIFGGGCVMLGRMLKLEATSGSSGIAGALSTATMFIDWCHLIHGGSGIAYGVSDNGLISNSFIKVTGTTYTQMVAAGDNAVIYNVRCEGNPSASSGNRVGLNIFGTTGAGAVIGCTSFNHIGHGINIGSSNVAKPWLVMGCLSYANGGDGLRGQQTASQTKTSCVMHNMFIGNGGHGYDMEAAFTFTVGNRVRDNTSGNFDNTKNWPVSENDVSDIYASQALANAAEFVDYTNGDFRIKYDSPIYGMGYGPSSELIPDVEDIAEAFWTWGNRELTS